MKSINKKVFVLCLIVLMCITLCACQPPPGKQSVVSKNDGSFDISVANSSEKDNDPDATQQIVCDDLFSSTDGSVDFTFHINQKVTAANMPVVKVAPHFLTENDASRAARAIYGINAEFWEAEPTLNAQFSKEEIQQQIARWSPYTTPEKISTLYGSQSGNPQEDANTIKTFIEHLSLSVYPDAPTGDFRVPCQWTFQNESHYLYGEEGVGSGNSNEENQQIQAWTMLGNYFYNFQVTTRNKNDYKLNNIYASPVYISPLAIDYELLKAEKLRTDYPTEEQINIAEQKAQSILDEMGLGNWIVDKAYVDTIQDGEVNEYTVRVGAVPVFNNAPAIRRAQLNNLKSKTTYASNYYLTDANFSFSANGDLIDFSLFSPIDIEEIVNENVSTISVEFLLERAREHMSLSDYYSYGFGEIADTLPEPILCKVDVCKLEYGLTRVKVPDTDESYYYVPALFLNGLVEYVGKDTGSVYYSTSNFLEETQLLLIVNAIDGTIINAINE